MRVLRSTIWAPDLEPITMILPESSLKVSIKQTIATLPDEGFFVINDVFEMDDFDAKDETAVLKASILGEERAAERRDDERNMAITYYWTIAQFECLTDEGTVIMKDPAPLSVDQLRSAMEQIAKHPNYKHHSLVFIASDKTIVEMKDGQLA